MFYLGTLEVPRFDFASKLVVTTKLVVTKVVLKKITRTELNGVY